MPNLKLLAAMVLLGLTLSGCEKEGPAEKTGEEIDKAVEKATDSVKDATKSN